MAGTYSEVSNKQSGHNKRAEINNPACITSLSNKLDGFFFHLSHEKLTQMWILFSKMLSAYALL